MDDAPLVRHDDDAAAVRALVCAACRFVITDEAARLDVAGRHAHTFMNPGGVVFHLRCFARADGACAVGAPSAEYTWFPPLTWRFALCRQCRAHLGWVFEGAGSDPGRFFGLIEERVTT